MGNRFLLAALLVAMATPALAAESPASESTLVFDLATDDAVIDEHTAQMLWNLKTDNIVPERTEFLTGWNSLYLQEPEAVSGTVVVDLETGTILGEITERWTCDNDCLTTRGTPSWTTTRDTGWTATITDGLIALDNDILTISGSVDIRYDATVSAVENPSDCGGSPCYVCQERICKVGGEATTSVDLDGWIDGETLSLAFVDQLERDVAAMDFSGLETTEFFMSRFSITITGALAPMVAEPSPAGPTEEEPDPEETATPDESSDVEVPSGAVIPGVDAGSPPGDFQDTADSDHTATAGPAKDPRVDTWTLIAIAVLILSGTAGVLIVGFLIRRLLGWDSHEAAVDAIRAEGLNVTDTGQSHWTLLDQTSSALSRRDSAPAWQPRDDETPSERYASRPGLRSGRYRQVEFPKPVYLERQGTGSNIDLVRTDFQGLTLIGDPDPATPWRTPVFNNDGEEIGWVKTEDVPQ